MSEKYWQKEVVKYLEAIDLFFYAIPSVRFRVADGGTPIGYVKGMPDLHIPALKLYLEMKDIKPGKVKKHEEIQAKIHSELRSAGQWVYRVEGAEEAIKIINRLAGIKGESKCLIVSMEI